MPTRKPPRKRQATRKGQATHPQATHPQTTRKGWPYYIRTVVEAGKPSCRGGPPTGHPATGHPQGAGHPSAGHPSAGHPQGVALLYTARQFASGVVGWAYRVGPPLAGGLRMGGLLVSDLPLNPVHPCRSTPALAAARPRRIAAARPGTLLSLGPYPHPFLLIFPSVQNAGGV